MVLLDYKDKINVEACFSFKADIWSFDGMTYKIKKTFQPFIHTQQVSQSCTIFLESDIEMQGFNIRAKKQAKLKKKRGKSYGSASNLSEQDGEHHSDDHKATLNFKVPSLSHGKSEMVKSEGRQRALSSQENIINTNKTKAPQHFEQKLKLQEALSPLKEEISPPKENNVAEIEILPNQKTTLIFQFMYMPEYLGEGNNLIINMENLKAFGKITQLIPEKIDEAVSHTPLPVIRAEIKPIPEEKMLTPPVIQINGQHDVLPTANILTSKDLSKITEKQESKGSNY